MCDPARRTAQWRTDEEQRREDISHDVWGCVYNWVALLGAESDLTTISCGCEL
jgi:hypothetical protein